MTDEAALKSNFPPNWQNQQRDSLMSARYLSKAWRVSSTKEWEQHFFLNNNFKIRILIVESANFVFIFPVRWRWPEAEDVGSSLGLLVLSDQGGAEMSCQRLAHQTNTWRLIDEEYKIWSSIVLRHFFSLESIQILSCCKFFNCISEPYSAFFCMLLAYFLDGTTKCYGNYDVARWNLWREGDDAIS